MEKRARFAHLILPRCVRETSREGNGSGWSLTYECFLHGGINSDPAFSHFSVRHTKKNKGFLVRIQNFQVLHPLYMKQNGQFLLDSSFQVLHFPPLHFSSFPNVQRFVLSILCELGVPTSDPDPLSRLIFSFVLRHAATASSSLVPFSISFTITTLLRNHAQALDWLHGGTPHSHVLRTLRSSSTSGALTTIHGNNGNGSCMVCLEELFGVEDGRQTQRRVSRLRCSHEFHFRCISQWLRFDHRCPVCRSPMPWVQALFSDHHSSTSTSDLDHHDAAILVDQSSHSTAPWFLYKLGSFLQNIIRQFWV